MIVKFDDLVLKNIDIEDNRQVDFYNNLFVQNKYLDKDIINTEDVYLVYNNKDMIGFLSLSNIAVTGTGLNQIGLSYCIDNKYKMRNYEVDLINGVSDYLLRDDSNLLMLKVSRKDSFGQDIASRCGYILDYSDDDNLIYTKYAEKIEKKL